MWFIEQIGNRLRDIGAFLFGRGLVSFATITAGVIGALTGVGFILPALSVAIGGTILNSAMALRSQRIYEDQMVGLYRNEIAATLGVDSSRVTRTHLHAMAKHNDVIGQAITRQHRRTFIDIATGVLAGATTFGLLYVGLVHTSLPGLLVEHLGHVFGSILSIFSMGIVSAAVNLTVNDGLGYAIGRRTGVQKAGTHDRILRMEWQVRRGRPVTAEQVFDVLVASDPALAQTMRRQFGEGYSSMSPRQRQQILNASGLAGDMGTIATAINNGNVRPSSLAFLFDRKFVTKIAEAAAANEAANPARASFVERVGDWQPQRSHVERLAAERREVTTGRTV